MKSVYTPPVCEDTAVALGEGMLVTSGDPVEENAMIKSWIIDEEWFDF